MAVSYISQELVKHQQMQKIRKSKKTTIDDLTVDLLTRFDNFVHKWENEREPGKLLHPKTIEVQFNILRTLRHRAIEVGIMEPSKSSHAFAHITQEAGAESSAIKNILGHSNLATTERYMGSFDTSKTDNTLRTLFKKKSSAKPKAEEADSGLSKEEQALELLKGMTPEQIMAVISAINK